MCDESHRAEVARIVTEYERRSRDLPPDYYCLTRSVNLYFQTHAARALASALDQAGLLPLRTKQIADIGCGQGNWLLEFLQWEAEPSNLHGIDLSQPRIETARRRIPAADLQFGEASRLPWPDESFDIVSQFTVFSSVLDEDMRVSMASEMRRVVRANGVIVWYDFRVDNPRNRHVKGIGRHELRRLFPQCRIAFRSLTLAPPIARLVVPRSWLAGSFLETLPFLRTHLLAIIRK